MSLKSLKSKDIGHYFTPKLLNVLRYYMTLIFSLLHLSIVLHKPIKTIDVYNISKEFAQQKEGHIILTWNQTTTFILKIYTLYFSL